MGIVIRQSFKASLASMGGILLGVINQLWLFPMYLDPEEIGLYKVMMDAGVFFAIFCLVGSPSIAIRYFPYYKNKDGYGGFVKFILLIPVVGMGLFTIFFFLFQQQLKGIFIEKSPMIVDYFGLILPLTILTGFFMLLQSLSSNAMRIVFPQLIKDIVFKLLLSFLGLAVGFEIMGIAGFVNWLVVIHLIILILLIIYVKKIGVLTLKGSQIFKDKPKIREMTKYGMTVLLTYTGVILVQRIDSFMISEELGLESTGIYAISFFIGNFIEIPRRMISKITIPLIAKAFKENDDDTILSLYKKTSLNQLVIGIFLFLCVWLNIDYLFALIPNGEKYILGKYVVLIVAFAKLLDMAMGCNQNIILNSKYYRINLFTNPSLALVAVLLNLYTIPRYGINGAAAATLVSLAVINLFNYLYLYFKMKIQPLTSRTALVVLLGAAIYGIFYFIPQFNIPVLGILFNGSLIAITFLGAVIALKISPDINEFLDKQWKKYRGNKRGKDQ